MPKPNRYEEQEGIKYASLTCQSCHTAAWGLLFPAVLLFCAFVCEMEPEAWGWGLGRGMGRGMHILGGERGEGKALPWFRK